MVRANILVVEDEAIVALGIEEQLHKLGHEVVGIAERSEQAVNLVERCSPDLVLMDIRLKGQRDGVETAREIRSRFDIPIVFLTAYGDEATLRRAELGDAFGYLIKPCRESDLRATVATAIHRHEIEQRLRDSEQRFRTTIHAIEQGILTTDESGRIQFLNPEGERLTGRSVLAVTGQRAADVSPLFDEQTGDALEHPVSRCREQKQPVHVEAAALRRPDGSSVPVAAEAVPLFRTPGDEFAGVVLTLRGLAESRREAQQLQHLQRMEGLALIAAGVAHDFNNLLTPVVGFINMALGSIPAEAQATPLLQEALKAAKRASELTIQLLAYSGKGKVIQVATNLTRLVEEMMALLQASVSKKSVLRFRLRQVSDVQADQTQIGQVLLNLVLNASEALGDKGGEIRVTTGQETFDEPQRLVPNAPATVPPGTFVFLEVTDTGSGMDEVTRSRIFDPFFTTKFLGRGLGLAAVQGIVHGHGGTIQVTSRPGQGTTFHVALPLTMPVRTEPVEQPSESREVTERGTILLAEDDPAVKMMVEQILKRDGWTVIAAGDGHAAVELFRQHRETLGLVLLDLTMPRLSGHEVVAELHVERPQLPILVMSGFSTEEVASGFADGQVRGFIQKPFTPSELLGAIHKVWSAK